MACREARAGDYATYDNGEVVYRRLSPSDNGSTNPRFMYNMASLLKFMCNARPVFFPPPEYLLNSVIAGAFLYFPDFAVHLVFGKVVVDDHDYNENRALYNVFGKYSELENSQCALQSLKNDDSGNNPEHRSKNRRPD